MGVRDIRGAALTPAWTRQEHSHSRRLTWTLDPSLTPFSTVLSSHDQTGHFRSRPRPLQQRRNDSNSDATAPTSKSPRQALDALNGRSIDACLASVMAGDHMHSRHVTHAFLHRLVLSSSDRHFRSRPWSCQIGIFPSRPWPWRRRQRHDRHSDLTTTATATPRPPTSKSPQRALDTLNGRPVDT